MNKIYLGPWQISKQFCDYQQKVVVCYMRPLLLDIIIGENNVKYWFSDPTIFKYSNGLYYSLTYSDEIYPRSFDELDIAKDKMDKILIEHGYGTTHKLVFLTQEQFNKYLLLI